MQIKIVVGLLAFGLILVAGCIQTPAQVSQDTKAILNNTSITVPDITIIQPTFAPVTPNPDRTRIPTRTPAPTLQSVNPDPIVGQWVLTGQTGYSCYVAAYSDGTGRADCNSFLVPVGSKTFHWENTGRDANQSFMTDYNITQDDSDDYYSAQYSSISGGLYSTMLPANTYLIRER